MSSLVLLGSDYDEIETGQQSFQAGRIDWRLR
jgi:hypothetical protein